MRTLQNQVSKYDEFVVWCRKLVEEGLEYDREVTAEEREEMLELLGQSPAGLQEAIDLGLVRMDEPGTDA